MMRMNRLFTITGRRQQDRLPDTPVGADRASHRSPSARKDGPLEGIDSHLVSLVAPGSAEAEQYRRLRVIVERMHQAGGGTAIAVSSPAAGDGKSTTAINLAGALAQDSNADVVLIEADLHQPSGILRDHLALRGEDVPGLVDAVLDPDLSLEALVRRLSVFNLSVLLAGSQAAAPYEVLKAARFGELLAEARRRYDYVILDAPPFVPVADCRLIEPWIDGFLMVVAAHRTPRRALEEAFNLMKPEKSLGLIFNGDDASVSHHYRYGYGYGYGRGGNGSRWARALRGNGSHRPRNGR